MRSQVVRFGPVSVLFWADNDYGSLQVQVTPAFRGNSKFHAGFRSGTANQIQQMLAALAANGIVPKPGYETDPWIYFDLPSATNPVEAVEELCQLTSPLAPVRVAYTVFEREDHGGEHGDTVTIYAQAPPHGPEVQIANNHFTWQNADDPRVNEVMAFLLAIGIFTSITPSEKGECRFQVVLTDRAQADRYASYLALAEAFVLAVPPQD